MTTPTHILAGLVIGKMTGHYAAAIIASNIMDLDHLLAYRRGGVLFKPLQMFKHMTEPKDMLGDQRGIFHNVFVAAAICVLAAWLMPAIGVTVTAAYFLHLLFDALDGSRYWPFYPNQTIELNGPVSYCTWKEGALALGLVLAFFVV